MSKLDSSNKDYTINRYQEIIENIGNSVDVIILLQGILSHAITDITLSDLNKNLTKSSQSYLDKIKGGYIDYSDIKPKNFREQLELDSQMMLKAMINNSFEEYCRCACLQIEAALEYFKDKNKDRYEKFIDEDERHWKCKYKNINKNQLRDQFNKRAAYDFWYENTYKKERDIKEPSYNEISKIMDIRDATSHRTLGQISFEDNLKSYYTKEFYQEKDFLLVKERTQDLVRNILIDSF